MAASSTAGPSRASSAQAADEDLGLNNENSHASEVIETPTFKTKTIQELIKLHFEDDKTRISADALKMLTEMFRVLTAEAVARATVQAKVQCDTEVSLEHLEKVLPQLMLDFP
ncbi:centromere protein X-like [Haemaphysalis longicornis]